MNIFKRKNKEEADLPDSVMADEENPAHGENLPMGNAQETNTEETKENSIEQVSTEDAEAKDDVPSVNLAGREGGNAKTFKMMGLVLAGILIMLIGSAFAIGKYKQSNAEEKTKDAERQAQNQKNLATGSKLDLESQKAEMAMYDLPPPAGASATSTTQATVLSDEPDEPVQPIVQPIASHARYNDYNGGSMVAGRDYSPPAQVPVEQPTAKPIISYDDPEEEKTIMVASAPIAPVSPLPPPPSPSNVLVDVYGARTVSATQSQSKETGLGASMKSSQLANGSANKRGSTNMLLMQGTTIPCVLKTKINSDYQGFATCQLTKDVYSVNGRVLLLERGSTVFGEQNVQMTQGKARVSILWSKVETPKGISVSLDSPATGQLGEMGVGAKVNNHFWKRFSGAIMLSVIQDASAIARSHLEKQNEGGDTTNVTNTSSTLEGMAQETLKNTINIPPTAIVNQGTVINIMVARDVDFASVYRVVRR